MILIGTEIVMSVGGQRDSCVANYVELMDGEDEL
jgi:hypothetical protein